MSVSPDQPSPSFLRRAANAVVQWIDSDYTPDGADKMRREEDKVDWVRCIPFIILHLGCLGVIWTGTSAFAVWFAIAFYFVRMFFVTGIYHRYFSHKTYSTSRFGQFILAVCGGTTVQRGALWWAYHHRHHHQHSDEEEDAHSPHVHGFWWSHIGWITSRRNFPTDYTKVRDLAKYKELVFLNRFDSLIPLLTALAVFGLGALLETWAPGLHTNRWQMLWWGFFVSTTLLFHGTSCINSMAHLIGRRRFQTEDDSRNSWILAIITLGEGWHNNHHRYMSCTRQGFYWWEIDITYYILKGLSYTGFISGLKAVPKSILEEAARADHAASIVAAQQAAHSHPDYSIGTLKKVVPAAAAIAVATAAAAQTSIPKKADGPAIHKDVTEQLAEQAKARQNPPPATPPPTAPGQS